MELLVIIFLRYIVHGLTLLWILPHEAIQGVSLHDVVLAHVPYSQILANWNYVLWLLCYAPPALYIYFKDRSLFRHLMILDSVLTVLRSITIHLVNFGPVVGSDINAGRQFTWDVYWSLINPLSAIMGSAQVSLTKDLMFSGHIATTFLLYLISRKLGKVSWVFFALHLVTLGVVLLSHLHYTVDILVAYLVTYLIYGASHELQSCMVSGFNHCRSLLGLVYNVCRRTG